MVKIDISITSGSNKGYEVNVTQKLFFKRFSEVSMFINGLMDATEANVVLTDKKGEEPRLWFNF